MAKSRDLQQTFQPPSNPTSHNNKYYQSDTQSTADARQSRHRPANGPIIRWRSWHLIDFVCRVAQTQDEMCEPENTREDEGGIMLVFGEHAPVVGCPEANDYACDQDEEAQGDEKG